MTFCIGNDNCSLLKKNCLFSLRDRQAKMHRFSGKHAGPWWMIVRLEYGLCVLVPQILRFEIFLSFSVFCFLYFWKSQEILLVNMLETDYVQSYAKSDLSNCKLLNAREWQAICCLLCENHILFCLSAVRADRASNCACCGGSSLFWGGRILPALPANGLHTQRARYPHTPPIVILHMCTYHNFLWS